MLALRSLARRRGVLAFLISAICYFLITIYYFRMDKPKVTPKDFFLWAGAMVALYGSVISFIALLFEYINHSFPDPLDYYVDPYSGSIRFAMASLIVLVPVTILLMRFIRSDIARESIKSELWVRRW